MKDADFIIIGSGPAGVSAALPLAAAGRSVLMLDGASAEDFKPLTPAMRMLGSDLEGLSAEDGLSPKLRTPDARRALSRFAAANNVRGENFVTVAALARGGLSRVWGAFAPEFDAADLAGWPISHADLMPSYENIVRRIGVSGSVSDATGAALGTCGPLQPPPPLGAATAMLLRRYESGTPGDMLLGRARNALLSQPLEGRSACDFRNTCLWGCDAGAIYDARQDLARLSRYANFRLIDNARVTALEPGWTVHTAEAGSFTAPRVLLAAGTLGSTRLAAPLLPDMADWPILSNPVTAAPLLVPSAFMARTVPTHGLAQLAFILRFGAGGQNYASGAVYETRGLPPNNFASQLPLGRRAGEAAFRLAAPGLVVAATYFSGAFSRNRILFDRSAGRLTVQGGFSEELAAVEKTVSKRLRAAWRKLGALPLPGGTLGMPGSDSHFAATLPMGGGGATGTSVLGELNTHPGLYIVDGAALPSLASKHVTLTIMANADRIGTHLASQ